MSANGISYPLADSRKREIIASRIAEKARTEGKLKGMTTERVRKLFDYLAVGREPNEFTTKEQDTLTFLASKGNPPILLHLEPNGHTDPFVDDMDDEPFEIQSTLPSSNGQTKGDVKEAAKAAEVSSVENKQAMKPGSSGAPLAEPAGNHPIDSTEFYRNLAEQRDTAQPALPDSPYPKTITNLEGKTFPNPAYVEDPASSDVEVEVSRAPVKGLTHSTPAEMRAGSSRDILDASIEKALSQMSLTDLLKLRETRADQLREIQEHARLIDAATKNLKEPASPYPPRGPLASKPAMAFPSSPAQADETTVSQETEGRRWQSPPVPSQPRYVEPAGSISNRALGVMIAFLAGAVPTLLLGFLEAERMVVPPIRFLTPLVYFAMALGCVGAALVTTVVG